MTARPLSAVQAEQSIRDRLRQLKTLKAVWETADGMDWGNEDELVRIYEMLAAAFAAGPKFPSGEKQ
jgi:hypothetical protein